MLTIGSLFSGIGGLELGLEWAGLGPTVWQVEQDRFCNVVLAKHWPDARRFDDVRTVGVANLPAVDVICGGFPCQDVSSAGLGKGIIEGTRSGLWFEFLRIVGELRPRFVVVENVASGKTRWLCRVRSDLHALGYATSAYALSAADVGAPHLRRRVFVVARSDGERLRDESGRSVRTNGEGEALAIDDGATWPLAYADGVREPQQGGSIADERGRPGYGREAGGGGWWESEPNVGRLAHGVSTRLAGRGRRARLRALGNAVVPQDAEVVGKVIVAMMEAS